MLSAYLTAVTGMVVISCAWLAVQRLWQKYFPENGGDDPDALAGRSGCHNCDCGPTGRERSTTRTTHPLEDTTHAP